MRAKHYYKIIIIKYFYESDYFEGMSKTEKVLFETNKRLEAERFYNNHLYMESGTIYKSIYYPNQELRLIKVK